MKSTNSTPLKVFFGILIATITFSTICVFAIERAWTEDERLIKQVESRLQQHYGDQNININVDVFHKRYSHQVFDMPIHKIIIQTASGDIKFVTVKNSNQVRIRTIGGMSQNKFKRTDDGSIVSEGNEFFRSADISIELPENYTGDIVARSKSGDIEIKSLRDTSNLSIKNLEAESVSGDIELDQVSAQTSTLLTTSGEVKVTAKAAGNLIVNTTSGDVALKLSNLNEGFDFKIETMSGEVNNALEGRTKGDKHVTVTTVSGDIDIR